MKLNGLRKLFEVPRVEGQDKIDAFFDELIRGRRLPVYEDGRRVPLEIFNSPLRLLLVSQDPKHRYLVRAAGGFRTKAEINIRDWPEDDAIPDVRPAHDRAWHHWPMIERLLPPLAPDPTYFVRNLEGEAIRVPGFIAAFLRHCRSGRQPVFAGNMQIPPELFDHPFAFHILSSDRKDRDRKLVRDRWGRTIKGEVIIADTPIFSELVEQVNALAPHLTPELYVFE